MLQIEIFHNEKENELVEQINYFLKQIDEMLVRDIKYSSFAFFDGSNTLIMHTAIIIYIVK